jgi:hypothetical protein
MTGLAEPVKTAELTLACVTDPEGIILFPVIFKPILL